MSYYILPDTGCERSFRATHFRTPDVEQHRLGQHFCHNFSPVLVPVSLNLNNRSCIPLTTTVAQTISVYRREILGPALLACLQAVCAQWCTLPLRITWKQEPMTTWSTLSSSACTPSECVYAHCKDLREAPWITGPIECGACR